ncbi:MAG: glucose-6-phosphate isomerase [Firmicutes bacterium]|nr:glucose-6-phosphate isomerase [Bacillota bacterium]
MTQEIIKLAEKIRSDEMSYFIVIGTGGSINGAKAVIDALGVKVRKSGTYQIIKFVGDELDDAEIEHLEKMIQSKYSVYINYISKSGNTLEPKLVFEHLLKSMKQKYSNEELKQRIICTTTDGKGELYNQAKEEGWAMHFIPENVGGRYSIFTPAGLLPIAVAGLDIQAFLNGSKNSPAINLGKDLFNYTTGESIQKCDINVFVFFQKRLEPLGAWACQLFNESCGKDGKGIFSSTAIYPRDLHSLGQMVQDGKRNLVETFIKFNELDNCKRFGKVNKAIYDATYKAHTDDNIPVIQVNVERLDEFHLGGLMQLMMDECIDYCQSLDVNPFDQPGVEKYKKCLLKLRSIER